MAILGIHLSKEVRHLPLMYDDMSCSMFFVARR